MTIRRMLGTALVLAVVPLALEAQVPDQAQARIEAAIERVTQRGMPASLVQSKIAEGRAKGVPAARIAQAAERRAETLIRAHDAFARAGVQPREADYAAGADAIGRGVSAAAVGDLARSASPESRAVAIAVLSYLVTDLGIPQDEARNRVEAAGRAGPEALANLPAQAAAAMGRRGPPPGVGQGQGGPPEGAGRGQGGPPAGVGPPSGVPASGGEARGRGGERRGPPSGSPGGPPNN